MVHDPPGITIYGIKIEKDNLRMWKGKLLMNVSIREKSPIVHCMTNKVVANFQANGLLAIGASPIMGDEEREVEELVTLSNVLSLNIGTLNERTYSSMLVAGRVANQIGIPVVLDPVGVGATRYRLQAVDRLLDEVKINLIRCNTGELASLMKKEWASKGVDSGNGQLDRKEEAMALARQKECIVVVTGEEDIVTDGSCLKTVRAGHVRMTTVTGTGCLLSSILGAHLALTSKNHVELLSSALYEYGASGEEAAEKTEFSGAFQQAFLDRLSARGWRYDV